MDLAFIGLCFLAMVVLALREACRDDDDRPLLDLYELDDDVFDAPVPEGMPEYRRTA